jgi:predicted P-loop ATPase/GTPase
MERSLKYLAETDSEAAEAHADYERSKEAAKSIFAVLVGSQEGTVAQKEAFAFEHEKYRKAKEMEFECLSAWQAIKNKRSTESILIEVFRTQEASRRKGNIT